MKRVGLHETGPAAPVSHGGAPAQPRLARWGILAAVALAAACQPTPATIVADSGVTEIAANMSAARREHDPVAVPDAPSKVEAARPAPARAKTVAPAPRPSAVPRPVPTAVVDPYEGELAGGAPAVPTGAAPSQQMPSVPASEAPAPAPAARGVWIAPEPPAPLVPRARRVERDTSTIRITTPVAVAATVGAGGLLVAAAATGLAPSAETTGFALGALGVGTVGIATAGLLLLLGPDDSPPPRSPDPELVAPKVTSASVGPGSFAVAGRF